MRPPKPGPAFPPVSGPIKEIFTVSFWYRDQGIDDNDEVYLQFWDGDSYDNWFELGNTSPEGEWHHYAIHWRPIFEYGIPDFHIRFAAAGLDTGEFLWIDDVQISATGIKKGNVGYTKDYSGYNNDGLVHGATWTPDGIVGGAYSFDGDDHIRVIEHDNSLGGDGSWSEMSIEFWVKATTNTGTERLIWKHDRYDWSTGGTPSGLSYRVDFRATSTDNELSWYVYTPDESEVGYTIEQMRDTIC